MNSTQVAKRPVLALLGTVALLLGVSLAAPQSASAWGNGVSSAPSGCAQSYFTSSSGYTSATSSYFNTYNAGYCGRALTMTAQGRYAAGGYTVPASCTTGLGSCSVIGFTAVGQPRTNFLGGYHTLGGFAHSS